MNIDKRYDTYESGYAIGFEDGMLDGYGRGWGEAEAMYERRILLLNAELVSLNARIDRIETIVGGADE